MENRTVEKFYVVVREPVLCPYSPGVSSNEAPLPFFLQEYHLARTSCTRRVLVSIYASKIHMHISLWSELPSVSLRSQPPILVNVRRLFSGANLRAATPITESRQKNLSNGKGPVT